jgi:hypothetical protein
MTELFPKKV